MTIKKLFCALAIIGLLAGCERYKPIGNGPEGVLYVRDIYTGKIYFMYGTQMREVQQP